ncbi:hypothetical protein [Gaetbulibacter saemankumensis]|uniref:hypothetical protein n=1 Tax=Gaetbulibacter saemankumensis TaxID=311208 RepID=UPI0003F51B29|nr:hypothetical protein [Gaetbulibacter saemankumensis]
MLKKRFLVLFICSSAIMQSQTASDKNEPAQDSINHENKFLKSLGNGYFPTKYFNFDLRYLFKYNQYEGVRTGLGGTTNENFSEKFRFNAYTVYGFRDDKFKYSVGAGARLFETTNTWLNLSYTDDLQETGSTKFLTDKRFFQFFEPRLFNIDLFHHHITKSIGLEHTFTPSLVGEIDFSSSYINPTYNYNYNLNGTLYDTFHVSSAKAAIQWSPFSAFETDGTKMIETTAGYPKFTFQFTKSFKDVLQSDFNFSKFDFRAVYQIGNKDDYLSQISLVAGIANGDIPLTHLYHAYPNNITKETILQRFSVAGNNSFETMYFNEFFSDRFTTIQFKQFIKPFHISQRFQPQLVLITRYGLGDIRNIERHQNVSFKSLNKGYTESGFEINKILFGFGLSFTYRYGAYHLPEFEDNLALKFTFNLTL